MTAYLFPGQGSQKVGMGQELFGKFPDIVQEADHVLGYSIEKLCLEDPLGQLQQTEFTQPALYTVNALMYFQKIKDGVDAPAYLAGHSLGEYNALLAADVFDFETGLRLVRKRGALMNKASGGAMAAVLGLKKSVIEEILEENSLSEVSIANHNSHTQIVLSANKEHIQRAEHYCKERGASKFVPLKVSGAFHSPLMQEAKTEFEDYLTNFTFRPPRIPVVANCSATPYKGDAIAAHLGLQITSQVLWTETIEFLLEKGVKDFVEMGPGNVLSGLLRRIQKKS